MLFSPGVDLICVFYYYFWYGQAENCRTHFWGNITEMFSLNPHRIRGEKHSPVLWSTVVVHPETGQLPFKVHFKAGIDPQEQHLGPEKKTNTQRYPQNI